MPIGVITDQVFKCEEYISAEARSLEPSYLQKRLKLINSPFGGHRGGHTGPPKLERDLVVTPDRGYGHAVRGEKGELTFCLGGVAWLDDLHPTFRLLIKFDRVYEAYFKP